MKRIFLLPCLLITLSLVSFCAANKWIKYTSAKGHYSVSFPGRPTEQTDPQKAEDGTPMDINMATYQSTSADSTVYISSWIDFSGIKLTNTMKKMLEDSRDGALRSLGAKHSSTIRTNLTGNPYIEFTFDAQDFIGKDRIYIINKVQYSIITIGAFAKGITPDMDKFINSYTHLP